MLTRGEPRGGYGRGIAVAVRDRLVDKGHLKPITKQGRGQAVVYEATGLDLSGQYTSSESLPVRVRESKETGEKKGKSIPRTTCVKRFRSRYTDEERRVERLNETYAIRPLTSPEGLSWGAAFRVFNEGRMDRGGRLYGDWQQLKPEDRLQLSIDSEPVVEIDIVASYLFIVSAKGGSPIVARDPYSEIDWVKDNSTRKLAKKLVSAYISKDGVLVRFPLYVRGDFPFIPAKARINEYRDPILAKYPQLNPPAVSGMEAMFLESEAVISTIEGLITKGVVAYPVHDCLLVAEKHKDIAVDELWRQMEDRFGAKPWLKVTYGDGREERLDPSKRPSAGIS